MEVYEQNPDISDIENVALLLERKQHWLNWLFILPADYRYNFAQVAGAPMAGRNHTDETEPEVR